jgi:hypothetical protein
MNQQQKYPEIDWTKNEYHQLNLIIKQLQAVIDREDTRHMMDQHLTCHTHNAIEEAIALLEAEVDYDPTPSEPCEPPMTAVEMHTTAWEQHQEMHK